MTHTYAIAEVSRSAYDEIRAILIDAGYQQAIHRDGNSEVLDMHGIALRAKVDVAPAPSVTPTCKECGAPGMLYEEPAVRRWVHQKAADGRHHDFVGDQP